MISNYPRRRDEPDFADFLVSFPTFDFFDFSIVVRSDSGRQAHCPCSHAKHIIRLSLIILYDSYLHNIGTNVMEGAYIECDELVPFQFVRAWQLLRHHHIQSILV